MLQLRAPRQSIRDEMVNPAPSLFPRRTKGRDVDGDGDMWSLSGNHWAVRSIQVLAGELDQRVRTTLNRASADRFDHPNAPLNRRSLRPPS
jgi:hypothetical protein